ncbi:hypothetical protein DRO57_04870 [Candidatus Bathyarchaeota archaeon]|nr:MAG: hypothetical protein DRO57_04870 [Candidatus Bathyarchaeota archaeon]
MAMAVEELKNYGIPVSIIEKLKEMEITRLTDVQKLAIEKGLFEGKSMVVSAPTNTGKTFIAELAALVASTSREKRRTFYLVPLKAIAEEKFEEFQEKYSDWGLKIAISTGERNEYDPNLTEYDVVIATYEKLSALLIKNPEIINEIGVVVVDELQMIGDEERGVNLEILLTRLCKTLNPPQIIGLSATIPNTKELAEWLNAEVVETDKREVELREGIEYTGEKPINFHGFLIEKGDFLFKEFNKNRLGIEKRLNVHTFEGLLKICEKEQVIIFTNTQRQAEDLALRISKRSAPSKNVVKWIEQLDMYIETTPLTRKLKQCMTKGIAFHHAGLLPQEKRIVEDAFNNGDIKVICSTTTLGAGVNTPAKTVVILETKYYSGKSIQSRDYKNMAGRAGRIRYCDDFGRSILFAENEKEFRRLWHSYIDAKTEHVISQIPKRNLESSILSLIVSGICENEDDIIKFVENTFFGYSYSIKDNDQVKSVFHEAILKQLKLLENKKLIEKIGSKIKPTELGKRCAEEMITPDSAHLIYKALYEHKDKIVQSENYDYLIEPLIHLACCTQDARLLYPPRNKQEKRELMIYWNANKRNYFCDLKNEEIILRSVKTTQMTLRWIDGVQYSVMQGFAPPGILKGITETLSWILTAIARIAEPPLFDFPEEFVEFINKLSERVKYGVPENALEIMKLNIPAVHRFRAIALANAGYNSLESLRKATIDELRKVRGIGDKISVTIKSHVEQFIKNEKERKQQYLLRRAKELGRDQSILNRLFEETGDNFARACTELINDFLKLPCEFIGDIEPHEPDGLIEIDGQKIVIECKRKAGNKLVSAKEAEEILGKGAKYKPIAFVTIGYPEFTQEAKDNVIHTKVTLIPYLSLAKMLIKYWEGKITQEEILDILKSKKYVYYNKL